MGPRPRGGRQSSEGGGGNLDELGFGTPRGPSVAQVEREELLDSIGALNLAERAICQVRNSLIKAHSGVGEHGMTPLMSNLTPALMQRRPGLHRQASASPQCSPLLVNKYPDKYPPGSRPSSSWSTTKHDDATGIKEPDKMKVIHTWDMLACRDHADQVVLDTVGKREHGKFKEEDMKKTRSSYFLRRRDDGIVKQWEPTISMPTVRGVSQTLDKARSLCPRVKMPIVNPESHFRLLWLVGGLSFMVYEAYAVPVFIAFERQPEGVLIYLSNLINIYFLLDICLTFFTGYVDSDGIFVFKHSMIAKNYVKGWFILDVVAGIPWDWIPGETGGSREMTRFTRFLRAFRLLRLMRLLRLLKLKALEERVEVFIEGSHAFTFCAGLFKILFLLFGITHWACCVWYAIGRRDVSAPDQSWVSLYLDHRWSYEEWWPRYIQSLYFTLTTMTTVGYGDMFAQNHEERCYVLFLLVMASVIFAGLLGQVTDLITTLNRRTTAIAERKSLLSRYLKWRAVPRELYMAIRYHMVFRWDSTEDFDPYESEIKLQLTPVLRTELCNHIYGNVIFAAPFFSWMRDHTGCVKQLSCSVSSLFLAKGDVIFRRGQPILQVYMLMDGAVCLSVRDRVWELNGLEDEAAVALRDRLEKEARVQRQSGAAMRGFSVERLENESRLRNMIRRIKKRLEPTRSPKLAKKEKSTVQAFARGNGGAMDQVAHVNTDKLGDRIFEKGVLGDATGRMQRRDIKEEWGAETIQSWWRRHMNEQMMKNVDQAQQKAQKLRNSTADRKLDAPAYFGESCLWQHFDEWDTAAPLQFGYSAQCTCRGELVCVPRTAVQSVVHRFSPWLRDRLDFFQSAVKAGVNRKGTFSRGDKSDSTEPNEESPPNSEGHLRGAASGRRPSAGNADPIGYMNGQPLDSVGEGRKSDATPCMSPASVVKGKSDDRHAKASAQFQVNHVSEMLPSLELEEVVRHPCSPDQSPPPVVTDMTQAP